MNNPTNNPAMITSKLKSRLESIRQSYRRNKSAQAAFAPGTIGRKRLDEEQLKRILEMKRLGMKIKNTLTEC